MTVKRKAYVVFSWALVLSCMITIFLLSSQPAGVSQGMSDSLIRKIFDLLGIEFSSFLIRKLAHMAEFAGLSLLTFNAVYAVKEAKITPVVAFGITVVYAISDEIHQLFVDGRACQLRDVFIDSCGTAVGVIAALIILKIYKIIIYKRGNKNGSTQTL